MSLAASPSIGSKHRDRSSGVFALRWDPAELAIFQAEPVPAPGHGLTAQARNPDDDRKQIPERNQPGIPQDLAVLKSAPADHQSNREAKKQREHQSTASPERSSASRHGQQCP